MSASASNPKYVDYLFEDPEIPSQRWALLTIIGPNMPQKCDVYGVKLRGNYPTEEIAREHMLSLSDMDPDYSICLAEVGKFLPINVSGVKKEYIDERLNNLAKQNLENSIKAKEEFEYRKREDIKDVIKKNNGEIKENPAAVYNTIVTVQNILADYKLKLKDHEERLEDAQSRFNTYSQAEQEAAIIEFNTVVEEQKQ